MAHVVICDGELDGVLVQTVEEDVLDTSFEVPAKRDLDARLASVSSMTDLLEPGEVYEVFGYSGDNAWNAYGPEFTLEELTGLKAGELLVEGGVITKPLDSWRDETC
ncbi:hypothetical protein [Nocardioides sp. Root190]|uniref:hypothetical protein n=1 Tax=Nocardioides sp. Root190 TaxID=1736488 RepID=UPI0012F88845|nr:hypothetical protein [Nocardioides sp. Root190]